MRLASHSLPRKLYRDGTDHRRKQSIITILGIHSYDGYDITGNIAFMASFPVRHWHNEKVIIKKRARDEICQHEHGTELHLATSGGLGLLYRHYNVTSSCWKSELMIH
jgi:hypothetical protein